MPFDLQVAHRKFASELDSLDNCMEGYRHPSIECDIMQYEPVADGCVVALWDAWGRLVRSLILVCSAGPVVTLNGATISPSQRRSEEAALSHLEYCNRQRLASYPLSFPNRGEPKWYIVSYVEEIANTLELPLASQFGAAFNSSTIALESGITLGNPVSTVQTIRNYIAHKSVANLAKVHRAVPATRHISCSDYVRSPTLGGSTVFRDWADAMKAMAEAAIQ